MPLISGMARHYCISYKRSHGLLVMAEEKSLRWTRLVTTDQKTNTSNCSPEKWFFACDILDC